VRKRWPGSAREVVTTFTLVLLDLNAPTVYSRNTWQAPEPTAIKRNSRKRRLAQGQQDF